MISHKTKLNLSHDIIYNIDRNISEYEFSSMWSPVWISLVFVVWWWIDFNDMSTHLGVFYAERFRESGSYLRLLLRKEKKYFEREEDEERKKREEEKEYERKTSTNGPEN